MKPENIPFVLNKFNSFNKSLQFTVDTFDNEDVHFLDIKIDGTKTDIYYTNLPTQANTVIFPVKLHGTSKFPGLNL